MKFAENQNKVKNIVEPNFEEYQNLYKNSLEEFDLILENE